MIQPSLFDVIDTPAVSETEPQADPASEPVIGRPDTALEVLDTGSKEFKPAGPCVKESRFVIAKRTETDT